MSEKRQQTSQGSDFLKQGSILAMASLIVRFIGMIYRIPMSNILGEEGNGIYAVAVDVYDIVLIVSSYSIPLALSKIIAAQSIQKQYKNTGKTFRLTLYLPWFPVDYLASFCLPVPDLSRRIFIRITPE